MPKKQYLILIALIAIVIFGGIAYGSYYFWQKSAENSGQKICTMEAKLCPDGLAVGRTGPNCEFAACPISAINGGGNQKICTQEAKQCSDGSYVSRTGQNCEFAACPGEGASEKDGEKIYSVDELMASGLKEGVLVRVRGNAGNCLDLRISEEYEGPGSGCYLDGENKSISIGNVIIENSNQSVIVSGKVAYCGGKKIPKYICALTDAKIEE